MPIVMLARSSGGVGIRGYLVSLTLFGALLGTAACGGRTEGAREQMGMEHRGTGRVAEQTPPSGTGAASAAAPAPGSPIDEALAERGEQLFQSKGCIGCHTIGKGRLTGPDLAGVVDRRNYDWLMAMITNPDSMLKNDAAARQLFAEYMTPMLNMGVTQDEARALYEFLREESH